MEAVLELEQASRVRKKLVDEVQEITLDYPNGPFWV